MSTWKEVPEIQEFFIKHIRFHLLGQVWHGLMGPSVPVFVTPSVPKNTDQATPGWLSALSAQLRLRP